MTAAKEHAIEHHHIEILRRRVSNWTDAEEIRAYCDEVEDRHHHSLTTDPDAQRWLDFARKHADQLQRLPRMPPDPELKPDDLKPYLGGWGPYGPQRGWR
jgi:hypothetical protein